MTTCGCKVSAPEADPARFCCPCGAHCTDPECVAFNARIASGASFNQAFNEHMDRYRSQKGRKHK